MKIRQAFVANSSSSSFLIMRAGKTTIKRYGHYSNDAELRVVKISIVELIVALQAELDKGETEFSLTYGAEWS